MGSPHGPAYPSPQVQGQTRKQERFWKRGEHWEVVAGEGPENPGAPASPKGLQWVGAEAEECSRLVAQGLGKGSSQAPPGWPLPVPGHR